MPRRKVNLKKLPLCLQYLIAIAVAALIFGLIYLQEGVQPTPNFIQEYVIEKPGATAVALVILVVFIWLLRWFARRP